MGNEVHSRPREWDRLWGVLTLLVGASALCQSPATPSKDCKPDMDRALISSLHTDTNTLLIRVVARVADAQPNADPAGARIIPFSAFCPAVYSARSCFSHGETCLTAPWWPYIIGTGSSLLDRSGYVEA